MSMKIDFCSYLKSLTKRNRRIALIVGIILLSLIPVYFLRETIMSNANQLDKFFAHPFILLVSGAIITSIIIPFLTNRWQDHKKKLEIKTELVTSISETIAIAIGHTYSIIAGHEKETSQTITDKLQKWVVSIFVIGSKLRVYYPDTVLPDEWDEYKEALTNFWNVSRVLVNPEEEMTEDIYAKLKEYFESEKMIDWKKLLTPEYFEPWFVIRGLLLIKRNHFVKKIISDPITVF